jgi:hypothetical protein
MKELFDRFEEATNDYLEKDRAYREAKATFILSLYDTAFRPKPPALTEIDAMVNGNTNLNDLKMAADKAEYTVRALKYMLENWSKTYGVPYESQNRIKEN